MKSRKHGSIDWSLAFAVLWALWPIKSRSKTSLAAKTSHAREINLLDFFQTRFGFIAALVLLGLAVVVIIAVSARVARPPASDAQPEEEMAKVAAQATPSGAPEAIIVQPTLPPVPSATPEPVWVAADKYVPSLPEIPVPPGGLICKGSVTFTIEETMLVVAFNGRTERIAQSDPLFTTGARWALIVPLNRWGVTYLDPSKGSGQSSQFTLTGWIVDNKACQVK